MPNIEMHLMQGRSREQNRAVAEAISETIADTLGVKPEQICLPITEHGGEDFPVGGIAAGQRLEPAGNTSDRGAA